jgi:putative ABC transport system permease protein
VSVSLAREPFREIVGVVSDIRHGRLEAPFRPAVYVPHAQYGAAEMHLLLRAEQRPEALVSMARVALREIDPRLAFGAPVLLEELVARAGAPSRFRALLLALFAGVALLLAAVGLYGVVAYTVSRRTREIGLRLALGAGRGVVLRSIAGETLGSVALGVVAGLVLSAWLSRLVSGLLFGVSALDPLTYLGVPLLLMAVALVACWLPARNAASVDPAVVLRYE